MSERNRIDSETDLPGQFPITVRTRTHVFHADVGPEDGGSDSAPGAHDYFDASLAACKSLTAMWYAKRKGIPLERVETHVERDDSDERKGIYRLRVRIVLHGQLTDDQRASLHAAIAKCPVSKLMTTTDVVIETLA
jgi:putative redox protein